MENKSIEIILLGLFGLIIASTTITMAQNQDIDTLFNESSNTLTALPLVINNPALKTGFVFRSNGSILN